MSEPVIPASSPSASDGSSSFSSALRRFRSKLIRWGLGVLVLGGIGFALWTWGSLTYVYSKGERAGYVQKFSKRGWVFKTWEGELAMVNLPGAMPEIFSFTVRDASVAKRLEETLGRRVVISYDQHKGVPSHVFGDTSYFVVEVRLVEDAPPTEAATPPVAPGAPSY